MSKVNTPRVHLLRGADHRPVVAPADHQEARRQAATHLKQLLRREPQLGAVLEVEHHAGEPCPHRPVNPVEAERPLDPVRPEILHVCHQCVLHGKVRRFRDRRDGLCRVNAAAVACGEDVLVDVETLVAEADADAVDEPGRCRDRQAQVLGGEGRAIIGIPISCHLAKGDKLEAQAGHIAGCTPAMEKLKKSTWRTRVGSNLNIVA